MEVKETETLNTTNLVNLPDDVCIELVKHREELEDKKYRDTYDSCCFRIDRRMLEYMTQTIIGIGIITFCSYQLTIVDCEGSGAFWGLLGSTCGFFLKTGLDKSK